MDEFRSFQPDIRGATGEAQRRMESAFETFVEVCLVHMIARKVWKRDKQSTLISQRFTIADEALAMVLLENNATEWKELASIPPGARQQRGTSNKKRKYTHQKSADGKETSKGWVREGILRYNVLAGIVEKGRRKVVGQASGGEEHHHQIHISVEWEERLLVKYATQGRNGGDQTADDSTGDGILSGVSTVSHSVENPDEEDVQPLAIDFCEKERDDMDPTVIINELDGFGNIVAA